MELLYFGQVTVLVLQCFLVAIVVLLLYRIRGFLGIGVLYAALGLFQYMQVFLASTLYLEVADGLFVSPGSAVLFTASLFTVLLVYIKEDSTEIRRLIYALVISNLVMTLLLFSFGWNVMQATVYNPYNVSVDLFTNNGKIFIIGTIALFFDSLLIIILYERISRNVRSLFLRILFTMALVVTFDSTFFITGAFLSDPNFKLVLISGIISKNVASVIYSCLFYVYFRFFDDKTDVIIESRFSDIFHTLSYRQRFEQSETDRQFEISAAEQAIARSEIKYQTLANISPVGIFRADIDGNTVYVNPKWCEFTGICDAEKIGEPWYFNVHPSDRIALLNNWNDVSKQNKHLIIECRLTNLSNKEIWVLGQIVPELDSDANFIGYVGTFTEITDIKNYQQQLQIAREKAEESDKLKSSFLQNMSHEIRTPMNAILGFSEFLNNKNLTEEKKQGFIKIIQSSSKQLLDIVNNILTISFLETKQEKLKIKNTNVNALLSELLSIFKLNVNSSDIQLFVSNELPDEDAEILTDRTKITQILTNLITNSVKFTSKGQIEFGCRLRNDMLEFFVKDTGMGIEPERLEVIFDRFVQANDQIHVTHGGTGLGLSIAKGFVELLGGTIWVESTLKIGTAFYFTIPYMPYSKQFATKPPPLLLPRRVKILIAEDEINNLLLLQEMLSGLDVSIVHAYNGLEALEYCKNDATFDLILMDIKMPIMDGLLSAKLIREQCKYLPIILQSAYEHDYEIEKQHKLYNGYLRKPINKKELLTKIIATLST